MTWAAAAIGAAAGLLLAPVLNLVADEVPRRRGLEPRPVPQRLLVLAAAGALALGLCGLRDGLHAAFVVAAATAAVLVLLSVVDLEHRIVPNEIVLPAAAVVLAARTALWPSAEWAIAAVGAAAFLLVAALVYPAGLGMGDVKLVALIGAATGRWVVAALLIGFGAIFPFALGLLVVRGRAGLKTAVPFVPFLALGGLAALLLRGG